MRPGPFTSSPMHRNRFLPASGIIDHFDLVVGLVAERFHVSREQLVSRQRPEHIAWPRHICFWLLRQNCGKTFAQIGDWFHRHHGSVMYGCLAVEDRKSAYQEVAEVLNALSGELQAALIPVRGASTSVVIFDDFGGFSVPKNKGKVAA